MCGARWIAQPGVGGVVAELVAELAAEHEDFFAFGQGDRRWLCAGGELREADVIGVVRGAIQGHRAHARRSLLPAARRRLQQHALAIGAGELPPRIAAASDYYLCRSCAYARRCWEE